MATGDETQAGPRPSLPPQRPTPLSDQQATRQAPLWDDAATEQPGSFFDEFAPREDGFGADWADQPPTAGRDTAGKPQILAPQANRWSESGQQVTELRRRRPGMILALILAVLAVVVVALILAAWSVLRGGDDGETTTDTSVAQAGAEGQTPDATATTATVPPTSATTVLDPNALQVVLTEDPFVCDGATRQFGQISGAAPNEEVSFTSPQSAGLRNGQADADGVLPINWQCGAEQAGTTWELTATGITSGKAATFIFAGVTEAPPVTNEQPAAAAGEMTVAVFEDPFSCDGTSRVFGELSGADPNEEISFTSPQATGISNGQADAQGVLPIRWLCGADQAGTTWELTATGVTSGRTVVFSFTGS